MKIPVSSNQPNWVQKLQFTLTPLEYLDHAIEQNLDIFQAPIIGNYKNLLLVSNPEAIQQIFSNENQELLSRRFRTSEKT